MENTSHQKTMGIVARFFPVGKRKYKKIRKNFLAGIYENFTNPSDCVI